MTKQDNGSGECVYCKMIHEFIQKSSRYDDTESVSKFEFVLRRKGFYKGELHSTWTYETCPVNLCPACGAKINRNIATLP